MIRRLYKKHQEKFNYLLVGIWNTIFGYSVFVALYYLFGQWAHYMFIWVVSTVLAITNAYIGFKSFVFRTKGNYLREYLRFYVVYSGSMLLNIVLLPLCVEILRIAPPAAQGGIICVGAVVNYLGHKHFSFSPQRQSAVRKSASGT